MTDKISLCTPTRRRPERFQRMLQSAWGTAHDASNVEVVAVLDEGEPRYLIDGPTYVHVPRPTLDGATHMSGLWSRAWENATGDIAMMCADDVVFETPGWDERVREAFRSVPDRIVMVYAHAKMEDRPVLPFVSREWIDVAGFTPDHLQGWFSDEWIWSIAADIGRVIFLDDVVISHEQIAWGPDSVYIEGQRARERMGGLESMRNNFYSIPEVQKRDELARRLEAAKTSTYRCSPAGPPEWESLSRRMNTDARAHARMIRDDTLVVVHAYSGDRDLVKSALPVHLAHNEHVLVLSPSDAPVRMKRKGVECRSAGGRGYFGQVSLDRQRMHLEMLLEYPHKYFLLNDADSMCLSPYIPRYLYKQSEFVWSNEVHEWRPHASPYPKIAMQPPYFLSRQSIERLLSVADKPEVRAHPITPFIDWYMVALCHEAGVQHRNFKDGASFPAWGWNREEVPDTTQMGDDWEWQNKKDATIRGDEYMRDRVKMGVVMIHSVKHPEVLKMLLETHEDYVRRGSPSPRTLTLDQYVEMRQNEPLSEDTVRVAIGNWDRAGDIVQI